MHNASSLTQSILAECEDDHVGLWSVIRDVEKSYPDGDEAGLRDYVLSILAELLRNRKIKAGFPTSKGRFRSLRSTPDKIILRIEKEWPIGRRPKIGEGLWFTRARTNYRTTK